jgi:hypothetical protein
MEVLGKRLGRFGLTLHPDKTHFIDFRHAALLHLLPLRTGARMS